MYGSKNSADVRLVDGESQKNKITSRACHRSDCTLKRVRSGCILSMLLYMEVSCNSGNDAHGRLFSCNGGSNTLTFRR